MIALCAITKGDSELKSLKRMINSAIKYVDNVYITANHEHAKTEKYCKENNFNFTYLPWNKNFAEQRNFNFSQVKEDYILWADSDDILVGGEYLKEIVNNIAVGGQHTIFLDYWYGCRFDGEPSLETLVDVELHHPRERILKKGITTWKKRIHETPIPKEGIEYRYVRIRHTPQEPDKQYPIAVLHAGADRHISNSSLQERMKRNQELLELELEDERKEGKPDPRTILYLLKIYAEQDGREQDTISLGEEYLTMSGWDEERAQCYMYMSSVCTKVDDHRQALKYILKAIEEYPHIPLYHLMTSECYLNLKKYKEMKFYLDQALRMEMDMGSTMQNSLQTKLLASQLILRWHYEVKKDTKRALSAARTVFEIQPTKETKGTVDYLADLDDLNDACASADKLIHWMIDNNKEQAVESFIRSLPQEVSKRPFAIKALNRYGKPKKWASNEICYYASFGGPHFEQWDSTSLTKGIGGSETAIIELAKEWTKLGFKVTVYGDPIKEGEQDGVTYLPWFKFNPRDHFNIFIQWRNHSLAKKIVCKKFLVDLHDVWSAEDYNAGAGIDYVMVKSNYHKELSEGKIPDRKFAIISNGIKV